MSLDDKRMKLQQMRARGLVGMLLREKSNSSPRVLAKRSRRALRIKTHSRPQIKWEENYILQAVITAQADRLVFCPACGSPRVQIEESMRHMSGDYYVRCWSCLAHTVGSDSFDELRRMWKTGELAYKGRYADE